MTKGLLTAPLSETKLVSVINERINFEEQLLLPDYCPDIERIVFLRGRSCTTSLSFSENEVSLSGITYLNLCYESENGEKKRTEFTVPYRQNYPVSEVLSDPCGYCRAFCTSVSYKLISKRRLDVRGNFRLDGKIFDVRERDIPERSESRNIIVKDDKISGLIPFDSINEVITVREEFLLKPENEPLGDIIDCITDSRADSLTIKDGDLVLSGEIFIKVLYSSLNDPSKICSFIRTVPFKKEWSGSFNDDFSAQCSLNCISHDLGKSEEIISEEGKLLLECEISADIIIFSPFSRSFIKDAFSTEFESRAKTTEAELLKEIIPIKEEKISEGDVSTPSDAREIIEHFTEVKNLSIINENAKKCFCDVEFNIIYLNQDGNSCSFSHILRSDITVPVAGSDDEIRAYARVKDSSVSLSGGKFRLSASLILTGSVFKKEKETLLEDLEISEDKKSCENRDFSMVIYYAGKDDSVWNIAKKYKADPEKIKDENSVSDEIFKERTPLVIPL